MTELILLSMLAEIPVLCFGNPCWCASWWLFAIPISFFVWIDAERRDQPGCLWALIILIFHFVGLLLYLVIVGLKPRR